MAGIKHTEGRLSEGDLNFLIETVSPEIREKSGLGRIIREDEDFRKSYAGDEKVFRRVMGDEEILLKISPALFFEILLRRTSSDLEVAGYTLETDRTMKIPIFDTREVLDLLAREPVLLYLAEMLASFTRVESYALSVRVGKGIWEKIRFNDLDIQSLKSICDVVDEEYRLGLYKRIADICLFILGIFPDYARRDYRYPFSGQLRPHLRGKFRISPEDYEKEGGDFTNWQPRSGQPRNWGCPPFLKSCIITFKKPKSP
jgi:hypothetical protein